METTLISNDGGATEAKSLVQSWSIPAEADSDPFELNLSAGETILVVGPNGAGKSALSYWLAKNSRRKPVTRIYAQRQVWLASAAPDISSTNREQFTSIFENFDRKPESRVKFDQGERRSASLMFDLAAKVNEVHARVTGVVNDGGSIEEARDLARQSLLVTINKLLTSAGFQQDFEIGENNYFVAKMGDTTYPISDMSDGEKAAFLLAAEVLLAPKAATILIDEPERHLHRGISSSFILELIHERSDCSFILFTHDVELMATGLRTILIHSTQWRDKNPLSWEMEELSADGDRTERVRLAVLGGRGRVLLTEGEIASLDKSLYEILYPEWTIQPVGGKDQVERAVTGLNTSSSYHWVDAAGIVDGDCRSEQERRKLLTKGILVLPVNEVENIYFLPFIVEHQAKIQSQLLGRDSCELLETATDSALKSLGSCKAQENLVTMNARKIIRQRALQSLPQSEEEMKKEEFQLQIQSPWAGEMRILQEALSTKNHEDIVKRFSIRNSAYGSNIAKGLMYPNIDTYRDAVRVSLKRDSDLRAKLLGYLGQPKTQQRD